MSASRVPDRPRPPEWVDVTLGAGTWLVGAGAAVTTPALSALGRLAPVLLHPPGVPAGLHPARLVTRLATQGGERRTALSLAVLRLLDVLVPRLLDEVLRRARLTELVLEHLDVDAVVAHVDLDGAAARLDVDAVVERADLDAAVARVDLDAVVARVDLDAAVARVDLDAVVKRLDLTALVLERVDLERLVDAVLAETDLVGLAREVIDGVDLPAIIRESTGSMASDTVRGARMQSIVADEALGRAVDRLLLRRRGQALEAHDEGERVPPAAGRVPQDRDW